MNPFKERKYTVEKQGEWWQELGKEMTAWYGKNCYWIFWKHPQAKIMRAWHIAQKENDHELSHLIQNIKAS